MSVNSEIERLQNAKSALKTTIEGKGVTVPSNAKLEDYPALVNSIETGGGDIASMLTKENLVSVTYLQYQPHQVVTFNKDNNFYILNYGDSLGKLNTVSFIFKDITITWDVPPQNTNEDENNKYGVYIKESQEGSEKYQILNISGVTFSISDGYNATLRFYINNDVVATYQYLD